MQLHTVAFRNPDSEKNIRRLDSAHNRGFQVVITRDGKQHAKYFADAKYGGKERARRRARSYRDDILREMAPPPRVVGTSTLSKARSNTGIKGISVSRRALRNGGMRDIVQANVRPAMGVGFQRTYTVKDGETLEEVIARAQQWRTEVLAERQVVKRKPPRRTGPRRRKNQAVAAGVTDVPSMAAEGTHAQMHPRAADCFGSVVVEHHVHETRADAHRPMPSTSDEHAGTQVSPRADESRHAPVERTHEGSARSQPARAAGGSIFQTQAQAPARSTSMFSSFYMRG